VIRQVITGALSLLLLLPGWVQREGRNSDCRWPSAQAGVQRDLRDDLEFAEELAIRFMDAHAGPAEKAAAAAAKNRCMGILLQEVGKAHGMSARAAFGWFRKRSLVVDGLISLPFLAMFLVASVIAMGYILRRYPFDAASPGSSLAVAASMVAIASLGFGLAGLLAGQQWSAMAESVRIGTTHLSNRTFELPMNAYPGATFGVLVGLFWMVAVCRYAAFSRGGRLRF
jgi:hypothetical protein